MESFQVKLLAFMEHLMQCIAVSLCHHHIIIVQVEED